MTYATQEIPLGDAWIAEPGKRFALAEIKGVAFEYIEVFYNRKRQHSTLGYRSPAQFLERWISRQHQEKLAA